MRLPAVAVLLALVLSPSALAGTKRGRPINPAVSQYVEMIPTATGQRPVATQPKTPAPRTQTATTPLTTTTAATAPVVTPPLTRATGPRSGSVRRTTPKHQSPHRVRPARGTTAPTRRARSLSAVASPSFVSSAVGSTGSGGAWLVVLLVAAVLAPLAVFGALRRS